MAYNDRKILEVLLGELEGVPERCDGYREDVAHLLGDVLNFERDHAITRINIVNKIADQVNTVGTELYKSRQKSASEHRNS